MNLWSGAAMVSRSSEGAPGPGSDCGAESDRPSSPEERLPSSEVHGREGQASGRRASMPRGYPRVYLAAFRCTRGGSALQPAKPRRRRQFPLTASAFLAGKFGVPPAIAFCRWSGQNPGSPVCVGCAGFHPLLGVRGRPLSRAWRPDRPAEPGGVITAGREVGRRACAGEDRCLYRGRARTVPGLPRGRWRPSDGWNDVSRLALNIWGGV